MAYQSSLTKRNRRGKSAIETLCTAMYDILAEENPMTVRQVFYRMVSAGQIGKTENEYKNTVVRLLGDMRRNRQIPPGWIADNTRWMRKPRTYDSIESMLDLTAETYRRALWANQPAYVEIWLEKDALAGVLSDVTQVWDVPLMVTRGYPSITYLYEAAETIASKGKPAHLYYFGDYDPSGLDIPQKVEAGLREWSPNAEIYFHRVAVNEEQIKSLRLPTRPTKTSDSRARAFDGESVEVDAIPPKVLRRMATNCIETHVDEWQLHQTQMIENLERKTLRMVAKQVADRADNIG